MIKPCKKPDVYEGLTADLLYLELTDDKGVYAYMAFDFNVTDIAVLHIEMNRFSHKVLRQMLKDWEDIKDLLKRYYIRQMVVTVVEADEKWAKFVSIFGFKDIKKQYTAIQEL